MLRRVQKNEKVQRLGVLRIHRWLWQRVLRLQVWRMLAEEAFERRRGNDSGAGLGTRDKRDMDKRRGRR